MSESFAALCQPFFRDYVVWEPEEATTLGLHEGDERLRDQSDASLAARAGFFRETLRALDSYHLPQLTAAERLDHDAMSRLCRHEVHMYDDLQHHLSQVEWSLYPYAMVSYQEAQGLRVEGRAAQCARFLAEHEANLRRGAAQGAIVHRSLLSYFVEVVLPPVAKTMHAIAPAAGKAYQAHIDFLAHELLPQAGDDFALGEEEYRWRLVNTLGVTEELGDIIDVAWAYLRKTQEAMLAQARLLDPSVRDIAGVSGLVASLQGARFATSDELVPHYREVLARAIDCIQEHKLFHLPAPGALDLGMAPYPPGMRAMGAGSNWPAPLLDPTKQGQFVINPDPAAHPKAWATILALHEGIPGHFLQSTFWQQHFGGTEAPVRFLCVADDVAIPRQYFGAMLNIEGYAIYAEEVMREAGFHEGEDLLFALVSHAIRAARTIIDISVHTGRMTEAEGAQCLIAECGYPKSAAIGEIERYKRGPIQAITYFWGYRQIEQLRASTRRSLGEAFSLPDFHQELFLAGPVLPASIGLC